MKFHQNQLESKKRKVSKTSVPPPCPLHFQTHVHVCMGNRQSCYVITRSAGDQQAAEGRRCAKVKRRRTAFLGLRKQINRGLDYNDSSIKNRNPTCKENIHNTNLLGGTT